MPVDHLVKKGTLRRAESYEAWLNYCATRSRSTFEGARIEVVNLGNNRFRPKTMHVESYSLWLHPNMVDFDRPVSVTTDGVAAEYVCEPSLLTALESFKRRHDWGLIYYASISVDVNHH